MQAQAGGGAVAEALCCSREVQTRRRDLRTLGLCRVRQGAASYPDLIGGAGGRQRHTPANFLQARKEFWRVLYFVHHYFHPNTPLLAAQDIHGLMNHISAPAQFTGRRGCDRFRVKSQEDSVLGKLPPLYSAPISETRIRGGAPLEIV